MSAWVPVVVAVISGPTMWALVRLEKRNSSQHNDAIAFHSETRAIIEKAVEDLRGGQLDIKHDVREVKQEIRDLRSRVWLLERDTDVETAT